MNLQRKISFDNSMKSIDQLYFNEESYNFVSQRTPANCNFSYLFFKLLQCFNTVKEDVKKLMIAKNAKDKTPGERTEDIDYGTLIQEKNAPN